MKVGVDCRALIEPYGSGVATYTLSMLSALGALENSPDLSLFVSGRHGVIHNSLAGNNNLKYLKLPNRVLNLTMGYFNYPNPESIFPKTDIVWQPNPLFFPALDRPHFVTIHDLSFIHFPQFFPWHTRRWYLRWVKAWLSAAPRGSHLMAVSEFTKRDIIENFPQWKGRVTVIPPPPPPNIENVDKRVFSKFGIEKPYILSLATIEPRKNVEALLASMNLLKKRCPELSFVVAGKKNYSLPKNNRAIHLGYVSPEDRAALLSEALCLVYPSFYEGYGYPPLEAFAVGTPVIASSAGALPETLREAALWVNPFTAEDEIAEMVSLLINSEALRQEYINRGRSRLNHLQADFNLDNLLELWGKSV